MKTLAALFVMAALALSACDGGYDPSTGMDGQVNMRGQAGADGTLGAGGAGGAPYVPDPAPTCEQAPAGTVTTTYPCDAGGGNAPTFNADGTQCYSCPGWPVPDTGCAIRYPAAISGGMLIHGPHDIFCPATACDPSLCHVK